MPPFAFIITVNTQRMLLSNLKARFAFSMVLLKESTPVFRHMERIKDTIPRCKCESVS